MWRAGLTFILGLALLVACTQTEESTARLATPSPSPRAITTSAPVPKGESVPATQLAYIGADGALWLVNADGSGRVRLGGQCRGARWLAWSPAGDALACRRMNYQAQTSTIQVTDLAGNTIREIDDVFGIVYSWWPPGIVWSPQGDSIAYRARDGSLKLANLKGGEGVTVAPNGIPLAWLQAERLIVGLGVRETGLLPSYEAYWLDLQGGPQERIPRLDNSRQFWLAPDGMRAVIVSGPARMEQGGAPLAVYDLENNQERPIINSAISYPSESIPIGQLAISVDSTRVYWANDRVVYRANMDGTGVTELGRVAGDRVRLSRNGLSASVVGTQVGSVREIVVEDLEAKTSANIGEWHGGLAWRSVPSTE